MAQLVMATHYWLWPPQLKVICEYFHWADPNWSFHTSGNQLLTVSPWSPWSAVTFWIGCPVQFQASMLVNHLVSTGDRQGSSFSVPLSNTNTDLCLPWPELWAVPIATPSRWWLFSLQWWWKGHDGADASFSGCRRLGLKKKPATRHQFLISLSGKKEDPNPNPNTLTL